MNVVAASVHSGWVSLSTARAIGVANWKCKGLVPILARIFSHVSPGHHI
jgi:hypothetical protein